MYHIDKTLGLSSSDSRSKIYL